MTRLESSCTHSNGVADIRVIDKQLNKLLAFFYEAERDTDERQSGKLHLRTSIRSLSLPI